MEISVLRIVTWTRYIPFRPRAFRIFIATPLSRLIIRFPYHTLAWPTSVCVSGMQLVVAQSIFATGFIEAGTELRGKCIFAPRILLFREKYYRRR